MYPMKFSIKEKSHVSITYQINQPFVYLNKITDYKFS